MLLDYYVLTLYGAKKVDKGTKMQRRMRMMRFQGWLNGEIGVARSGRSKVGYESMGTEEVFRESVVIDVRTGPKLHHLSRLGKEMGNDVVRCYM